jgi:hypothetical protein
MHGELDRKKIKTEATDSFDPINGVFPVAFSTRSNLFSSNFLESGIYRPSAAGIHEGFRAVKTEHQKKGRPEGRPTIFNHHPIRS